MEDAKITISRAFKSAAYWQLITTVFLALATWVLVGMHAAISVSVGGCSVLLGSYVAVAMTHSQSNLMPSMVLMILIKAEVIRIVVIVSLLLAVFRFYKELVPLALIGGLAAAALISGAGLRTLGNENK